MHIIHNKIQVPFRISMQYFRIVRTNFNTSIWFVKTYFKLAWTDFFYVAAE